VTAHPLDRLRGVKFCLDRGLVKPSLYADLQVVDRWKGPLLTGRLDCTCDPIVQATPTTDAGSGSMTENREWSEADLQRLVDDKVGESLQLEFKQCGALSKNPEGKAESGKDVSAMANAAGGIIIYGIVEKNQVADSIDVGLDPNVHTREWLEQVIDSHVQPRIEGLRILVVPLPSRQNNVAYVVEVPQAVGRAPHQASDHRYYKRANFLNQMMEDYEIRDVLRRARWPDLYLTWTIHGGIKRLPNRKIIALSADIENRSSEPAHYSSISLYFDERFHLPVSGAFEPHGQHTAPQGEQCKARGGSGNLHSGVSGVSA
jgi:hypothetical protein